MFCTFFIPTNIGSSSFFYGIMLMQGNDPYHQKLDINNLLNFPHNMKASHKQSLCQPFSVLFEKYIRMFCHTAFI